MRTTVFLSSLRSASHTIPEEIEHIEKWALGCNMKLNRQKTKEIIFRRQKYDVSLLPPPIPTIERIREMNILGVTFTETFSVSPHVQKIMSKGHQILYGLKILKAQGLKGADLQRVAKNLSYSSLFYASPAWRGFLTKEETLLLNSLLRKAYKWGFVREEPPPIDTLFDEFDDNLFSKILNNPNHSLHFLLPPKKHTNYNLRPRVHSHSLPATSTTLTKKNYLQRMIFKNSY